MRQPRVSRESHAPPWRWAWGGRGRRATAPLSNSSALSLLGDAAGVSREGRAQFPTWAAVNGTERAEARRAGSQGIILEPQILPTMCRKGGCVGPLHRDRRDAQASQLASEKMGLRVSMLLLEASVDSNGESRWASEQVGQAHPLLESNLGAAAGDHKDKADSCEGLSNTLRKA